MGSVGKRGNIMHGEEVINELGKEISKGKGCIVFITDGNIK